MRLIVLFIPALAACASDDGNADAAALPTAYAPPPPQLTMSGTCPGVVSLDIHGASPGGDVAILSATTPGTSAMPPPCSGTLSLPANLTLRTRARANNRGEASMQVRLAGAACQAWVQAVDIAGCAGSNLANADPTDTAIGGLTSIWTGTNYFRGNTFIQTNQGTLTAFEVWLETTAGCALDFWVHGRAQPGVGGWQVLGHTTRRAAGGPAWQSSGPLAVALRPGGEIGVGVAWACAATYAGTDISWRGDWGLGAFQGNYWDNAWRGPTPGYAPPQIGSTTLAYPQVYHISP